MCILLVEDEFLMLDAVQDSLEGAGFEVLPAEHGQEAIDHLDRYPGRFTCLVADYRLPQAHGAQVVEHLRWVYPFVPAVLATAHRTATTPAWRAHHRVHLLVKPYPLADLVHLVTNLVHPLGSMGGATSHSPTRPQSDPGSLPRAGYRVAYVRNRGTTTCPYGTIYLSDGSTVGFGVPPGAELSGGLWRTRQTPDRLSDATLAHIGEVLGSMFPEWAERPERMAFE